MALNPLSIWRKRAALCGIALLLALGCDSPDPAAEDPFQQLSKGPNPAGASAGGQPEGAPPPPAGEGQPGPDDAKGPPRVGEGPGALDPADSVTLSGSISIRGWDQPIQIDFTEDKNIDEQGRPRLTLLRLAKPGDFEVSLSKDAGSVSINVYLDEKGDGPGQGDIMLLVPESPISVGSSNITDLEIELDRSGPAPPPKDTGDGPAGPPLGNTAEPQSADSAPRPEPQPSEGGAPDGAQPGQDSAAQEALGSEQADPGAQPEAPKEEP